MPTLKNTSRRDYHLPNGATLLAGGQLDVDDEVMSRLVREKGWSKRFADKTVLVDGSNIAAPPPAGVSKELVMLERRASELEAQQRRLERELEKASEQSAKDLAAAETRVREAEARAAAAEAELEKATDPKADAKGDKPKGGKKADDKS